MCPRGAIDSLLSAARNSMMLTPRPVSASASISGGFGQKKKKARLFHRRGRWENARVGQQIYTYCNPFSDRLGSVKRLRHLLWIGNKPEPAETISQGFTVSSGERVQTHSEWNLVIFFFFSNFPLNFNRSTIYLFICF